MTIAFEKDYLNYLSQQRGYSSHTQQAYQKDLAEFVHFLMNEGLENKEVDHKTIRFYMTWLIKKGNGRRTIARKISSLRGYYRYLVKMNLQQENPFDLLDRQRYQRTLPEFVSVQEIKSLLNLVSHKDPIIASRNQALAWVLYTSGVRVSEAVSLTLSQVDLAQGCLHIVQGKGGRDRVALLSKQATTVLQLYLVDARVKLVQKANKVTDVVFLNSRGNPITARGVELIIHQMGQQMDPPKSLYPHMLRHSLATHLLDKGADLRSIQEILGHKNLSATQVYTHVSIAKMKETYEKAHPRRKKSQK